MMPNHSRPLAGALSQLIIVSAMLLPAACGTTPAVRYYLIPPQPVAAATTAMPTGTVLGLGPVSLPEYLARPQMVMRTSTSRLQYHDTHRWAEPLADNIRRVLQENLANLLQIDQVVAYPWPRGRKMNYQVTLDITRMDADSTGDVSLEGRWSLLGDNGTALITGRHFMLTAPAPGGAPDAVALAHGDVLARLAADIAGELRQAAPLP